MKITNLPKKLALRLIFTSETRGYFLSALFSTPDTTGLGQDETGNKSYFIVGINEPLNPSAPVEFNWWIIN